MMRLIICSALLIATAFGQDESSGYFGFPVGEISHDQSSTSGMLFLADPQTLIITNFSHLPHDDTGCFSIMLGPAPTQGDAMKGEKMTKDGILLRYSPLNILRRKRSTEMAEEVAVEPSREKRQQARGRVVPVPAPVAPVDRVQMDSLIERASDDKAAGSGESSAREQEKDVTLHATGSPLVAFALDTGRRGPCPLTPSMLCSGNAEVGGVIKSSGKTRRFSKRKEIHGDVHSLEMIRDIESMEDLDSSDDDLKKVLEDANDEKLIVDKAPLDSTDSFEYFSEGDEIRKGELKKVDLPVAEGEKEKAEELSQMEQMMIQEAAIMANSTVEASSNSTSTGEEGSSDDDGTSIIKDHAKRAADHSEVEGSGMDDASNKKQPGRHDRVMKGKDTPGEDRGMKKGHHKHQEENKEKMAEKMENRTHTASARQAGENDLGENGKEADEGTTGPFKPTEFSLPRLDGARASFSLREHGKLSDFRWIGIYDQCTKKAYQLHEIAGSEIPDLESVTAMKGVAANVSSESVQIVNCNTIVIQNFYFLKDTKRPNTFFHVGTGVYPLSVQSHQRVRVLGKELDDALESVNGKDLVVKLPDGIRTFDVDFLMVFNEDSNRAYGHTFIPSLLVPPCDNL
ncbi:hypothetical protein PMAYCL1PPCAC_31975 [Pristionchus mayeri]|uniref:DM13 domain-containing protein n=1 Tax=Pristionchus mayeri TaxID=1317129 RepID=A0AAN5DGP5_9BILA|nr:hypothetical protein PMAYCL1PPCAC_31975 [Pristionchus mayeri]